MERKTHDLEYLGTAEFVILPEDDKSEKEINNKVEISMKNNEGQNDQKVEEKEIPVNKKVIAADGLEKFTEKKFKGARKASKKLKATLIEAIFALGIGSLAVGVKNFEKNVHEHNEERTCCFINNETKFNEDSLQKYVLGTYGNIKNSLEVYERSLQEDVGVYIESGIAGYTGEGIAANDNKKLITLEEFEEILSQETNPKNAMSVVNEKNRALNYLNNCDLDVFCLARYVAEKEIVEIFGLPQDYIMSGKIDFHEYSKESEDSKYYLTIDGDKVLGMPSQVNKLWSEANVISKMETNDEKIQAIGQLWETCNDVMNKNTAIGLNVPTDNSISRVAVPTNDMYAALIALGCLDATAFTITVSQKEKTRKVRK